MILAWSFVLLVSKINTHKGGVYSYTCVIMFHTSIYLQTFHVTSICLLYLIGLNLLMLPRVLGIHTRCTFSHVHHTCMVASFEWLYTRAYFIRRGPIKMSTFTSNVSIYKKIAQHVFGLLLSCFEAELLQFKVNHPPRHWHYSTEKSPCIQIWMNYENSRFGKNTYC